MATATGIVERVYGPQDGRYDVKTTAPVGYNGNGKLATFKDDIANKVRQFVGTGQLLEIDYTIKQNGAFTNFYLDDVRPVQSLDQAIQANGGQVPNPQASTPVQEQRQTKMPMDPIERAEMRRSVALKAAADLAPAFLAEDQMKASNVVLLAQQFEEYLTNGADIFQPPMA